MPAGKWSRAETVYGSADTLTAIGAVNIVKVPY